MLVVNHQPLILILTMTPTSNAKTRLKEAA